MMIFALARRAKTAMMLPMVEKQFGSAASIFAFALSLSACTSPDDSGADTEAVESSASIQSACVMSPNGVGGFSVQALADGLAAQGSEVSLEPNPDGAILRVNRPDYLTGGSTSIGLDLVRQEDAASGAASCGPDMARVMRLQVGGEVITDSITIDALVMQLATGLELIDLAQPDADATGSATLPGDQAPPPGSLEPLPTSGSANGTCSVSLNGARVMAGACSGAYHSDSVVLSSGRDGCTVEVSRSGAASVYSYRDICSLGPGGPSIDEDIALGTLVQRDRCWVGPEAEICLD